MEKIHRGNTEHVYQCLTLFVPKSYWFVLKTHTSLPGRVPLSPTHFWNASHWTEIKLSYLPNPFAPIENPFGHLGFKTSVALERVVCTTKCANSKGSCLQPSKTGTEAVSHGSLEIISNIQRDSINQSVSMSFHPYSNVPVHGTESSSQKNQVGLFVCEPCFALMMHKILKSKQSFMLWLVEFILHVLTTPRAFSCRQFAQTFRWVGGK